MGEIHCAFAALSDQTSGDELPAHTKSRLAGHKHPRKVIFGELPENHDRKGPQNELRDLIRNQN
ncbi:hypothetical protein [Roseobacter sp.]|uniref:hypothetical protein n=1 Tax=Roseobacter sp. TaxID=1907202 RepID=UPI0026001F51|nr:hypothetical protein [Roseobacter sp.]